jgi:hypothetical protein
MLLAILVLLAQTTVPPKAKDIPPTTPTTGPVTTGTSTTGATAPGQISQGEAKAKEGKKSPAKPAPAKHKSRVRKPSR